MSKKVLSFFVFLSFSYSAVALTTFERYFHDTYRGLEGLRNAQSALVVDSALVDLTVLNDNTSPSNIGLDLLVQLEALKIPQFYRQANNNIQKNLKSIQDLPFHQQTGLFYNRYSSDGKNVTHAYVSAVDNIHIAFALWVVSETYPLMTYRKIAEKIFKRLNFLPLYRPDTGLFSGGMYFKDGKWTLESWNYDYFGSEGRTLYSVGNAIGLLHDQDFPQKTLQSLKIETNGDMLRMWDGGAFQLLLPRLLVNEEKYSVKMDKAFHRYAQFVLDEKERKGLPVPASFSACQTSVLDYNGKAGSPELVATTNADLDDPLMKERWDQVFTPHAAILAAPLMPNEFEQALLLAEDLGKERKLYTTGLGWFDGLHVKGQDNGQIVPVYLSLDQAMIALSVAQILSDDQMTAGNRALWENETARVRLLEFYRHFDD